MTYVDQMRRTWDRRARGWHHHVVSSPGFQRVLDEVVRLAVPRDTDACVDLGCGSGFLTLALAGATGSVLAVDISPNMVELLDGQVRERDLDNVKGQVADLASFDLPAASMDLVVSNYALHHLSDSDKRALLVRVHRWLRPGGRVVIADMMFGRGLSRRDRDIFWSKLRVLIRRGPAGAWRVAKNVVRFSFRIGAEQPAPPPFWLAAMRDAGFSDARYLPVVAEAGIVTGTRTGD